MVAAKITCANGQKSVALNFRMIGHETDKFTARAMRDMGDR